MRAFISMGHASIHASVQRCEPRHARGHTIIMRASMRAVQSSTQPRKRLRCHHSCWSGKGCGGDMTDMACIAGEMELQARTGGRWAAPFAWQCIPIVAQPMHPCLPLSTPCALHDSALVCASTQLQRAAVVVHQARSAVVVAVRAGPARASARRSASGHGDGGSEAASAFSACQHIMYCDGFGGRFWVPSTGGFGFRRSEWSCGLDGL